MKLRLHKVLVEALAVIGLGMVSIESALCAPNPLDQVLPVRGLCVAAPNPSQVDVFTRFVGEELAPRLINTLILRVDFNYQYMSRPELGNRAGLSAADVKKLVAVCRTNHIRLIPQINLLGHQSWQGPTSANSYEISAATNRARTTGAARRPPPGAFSSCPRELKL